MIKREAEKETQEDLKQVFRVFDKVAMVSINANSDLSLKLDLEKLSPFLGWEWICVNLRNQVCLVQVSYRINEELILLSSVTFEGLGSTSATMSYRRWCRLQRLL